MLIGYGGYALTFAITGQSGAGAAFLTDRAEMADGRTGTVAALQWTDGTQNTSDYVEITVTIASPLDATAAQGVVGVCNLSLPAGTKLVIAGVTQRLVAGARGDRSAWALPFATGNTCVIRIYNDVNGASPIVASAEFAIGEIFIGRLISLCTLIAGNPASDLQDQTAYPRTAGSQLWPLMRKNWRVATQKLGLFTMTEAKGGSASSIPSGGNPAGTIDVQTLRDLLSTTPVCAVCDAPSAGFGAGSNVNGIRFDKDFMQPNWMLARPSAIGQIVLDKSPFLSWSPAFMEAT